MIYAYVKDERDKEGRPVPRKPMAVPFPSKFLLSRQNTRLGNWF